MFSPIFHLKKSEREEEYRKNKYLSILLSYGFFFPLEFVLCLTAHALHKFIHVNSNQSQISLNK